MQELTNISDQTRLPARRAVKLCRVCAEWFPYLYLLLAGPFVIVLCFLHPPFEIPDEPNHFFRALEISNFDFAPHFWPGYVQAGAVMPLAASGFASRELSPAIRAGNERNFGERLARIRGEEDQQVSAASDSFVPFANTIIYNPLFYLPQAITIGVARLFSQKPYVWFYAARVVNALTAVALTFLALLLSRPQQLVLASVALLPMSLSQTASLSPDACLIGASILFVSLCLRVREHGGRAVEWSCALLAVWLILVRAVLYPGILAGLLIGWTKFGRRRALFVCGVITVAAAILSLAWSHESMPAYAGLETIWHANASAQLSCLAKDPLRFAGVLAATVNEWGGRLLHSSIGLLGWGNVEFPGWYYTFSEVVLGAIVVISTSLDRTVSWIGLVVLFAAAMIAIGIGLSMYLMFTPPCADTVHGLQGRYFIPEYALAAFLCSRREMRPLQFAAAFLVWILFVSVTLPIMTKVIVAKYYSTGAPFCTPLPGGAVNSPGPGATVPSRFPISGWAAAPEKTDRITLFVDGIRNQSLNATALHLESGKSTWSAYIDLSHSAPGKHAIVVEALSKDGCEADIGDFTVNTQQ